MSGPAIRVAFVTPLMGYTLWYLASAAPALSWASIAAGGAALAPILSAISRRPTAWPNLSWLAVGGAILLSYWAGSSQWNAIGVPLAVGLVVTSPIAVFGVLLVGRRSMPISLLVSTLALAVSAFDLAVVRQLHGTGGGPFDVPAWSGAIQTVGAAQLVSLGVSALGAAPGSPLGYLGDPVADLLGLCVVLGLLLALIVPSARTPQLVDVTSREVTGSLARNPGSAPHSASTSAGAPRTEILPDTAYQMTGVASLVAALVAVLLFQLASTDGGFPNVSAMGLAVIGIVVLMIVLADRGAPRPMSTGRDVLKQSLATPRARPDRPTPVPPLGRPAPASGSPRS